jgi:uncharacterized membrane protein YesL
VTDLFWEDEVKRRSGINQMETILGRKCMSTNQMSNPKYFNLLRGVSEITAWGTILLLGGGQIVTAFALASQFGLGVTLVTLCTAALTIVGALTGLALVYAFMALVESSIDSRNRLFASNTAGG